MPEPHTWQVRATIDASHVHVVIRSPGPPGHRPLAGTLTVSVDDWPDLRKALAELPAGNWQIEYADDGLPIAGETRP